MDNLNEILSGPEPAIAEYLDKNADRLLNDWSYASGTSNHAALGSHTHGLVKVFEKCTSTPSLQRYTGALAQQIFIDHMRVIYRSLFLTRSRQTVPALRLLEQLAKVAADGLYNAFDLTLNVIPKLLASKDFREPFILFYIAFVSNVGPIPKKDLVNQRKITKAWLSRLFEDSNELVIASLDCLGKSVLRNRLLNKSHKLGFFNDSLLQSLAKLLSKGDIAHAASAFFVSLFCDSEFGVAFPDNAWSSQQPNNKLTLAFLVALRPWDGAVQMDLCIQLLGSFSELVYPYFDHLAKVYPFLPKVSSFWFNYAVLHNRVIQLPVPELELQPNHEVVVASILPQPLTKSHLGAAVTFKDNALLAFQGAQVVQHALSKLRRVIEVYEANVWDVAPLLSAVKERIPSIQVLSASVQPQLLQTCLLACACNYYEVFGSTTTAPLPASVSSVLDGSLSGLELVQAQSILQIQTTVLSSTKWYNKSGGEHSFFTRLLKFALMTPAMATSAAALLKNLVDPLLMLQTTTAAHPIDALVYTLEVMFGQDSKAGSAPESLWNLIDEAVSRSARSPYSYIDQYPVLVSPFAVALAEQLTYVKDAQVSQWVASFLRALKVVGEDAAACTTLAEGLSLGKLPLDDYFEFVLSSQSAKILARDDLLLKISNKLELMATVQRACSSPELAGHLFSNVPPIFASDLASASCFEPVLSSNAATAGAFFEALRTLNATSPALVEALQASHFWQLALDLLPADFLIAQVAAGSHTHECIAELTKRSVSLPLELAKQHLGETKHISSLALDAEQAQELLALEPSPATVAAIVEASKFYQSSFGQSPEVLVAAARFAPECISEAEKQACLDIAYGLVASQPQQALSLCVAFLDSVDASKVQPLFDGETLSPSLAILARKCPNPQWLDKVVLALTKVFSERAEVDEFSPFFVELSATLQASMLQSVSADALNALISSLTKRLELGGSSVLLTLLSSLVAPHIKAARHLHRLLDYEPGFYEHKLLFGFAVYKLFTCNEGKNSTVETQIGILRHYSGRPSAADSMLLEILKAIESNISVSWVDHVIFWDLQSKISQEFDRPALLSVVERQKFQVTLCEDLISESAVLFDPNAAFKLDPSTSLATLREYDILHPANGYSAEFLVSCIASCDQLVAELAVDVKALCEMGLLPFVLSCLGSAVPNVVQSAQLILESMSASTAKYKESVAATLVVNKALYFLHQHKRMPPHLAIMIGQVAKVALNPSHFLHEKASDWLMAGPSVQPYDLPLFEAVSNSSSFHKGHELLWIIKTLSSSLVDGFTAKLYLKIGVFEWIMAQLNLIGPKSRPLKHAVHKMLARAELFGGANGLIKRAAALSIEPTHLLLNASTIDAAEWMGYS